MGNKSCNGKQFFWVEEAGTGLEHRGCCTDSGGSVMNASIAYFFGGGSVKYTKIPCGSISLVVFSSSGRAERSAYFLADVGSILCGSLEIRGHAEQGLNC